MEDEKELEAVTFSCVNKSMTLLLNDNKSQIKFVAGIYEAYGAEHIALIRESIKSSGRAGRFNVVSKDAAMSVIAQHKAAQKAAGIKGAIGSQSDMVKGPGARAMAEANMRDANVDVKSPEAKAVLDAIAAPADEPVGPTGLTTEATDILAMAAMAEPIATGEATQPAQSGQGPLEAKKAVNLFAPKAAK